MTSESIAAAIIGLLGGLIVGPFLWAGFKHWFFGSDGGM